MIILTILSWLCIGLGCFFIISSAIGCHRFADFFMRLHAAGVGDTAGAMLILLGIIVKEGFSFFSAKIALLMLFLLITSATSSHAIAKAAYKSGLTKKRKE
jgi:multicomponent Na+:H+ antiporter subunit G